MRRLRLFQLGLVEDQDRVGPRLGRKRKLQSERAHLFWQVMSVASRDRPERPATAPELGWLVVAVPGLPCALLLIDLLVRTIDFAAALGLVRARLTLRLLIANHALQDVGARLKRKKLVVEFDAPGGGRIEGHHICF